MAGRACTVCLTAEKVKLAAEMVSRGETDQAVADALGVSRVAARRHRVNHIEKPAAAIVEASNKGMARRAEREAMVATAESGDSTAAWLGLERIAGDLRKTQERLERCADAAEGAGQGGVVAQLSGQQHKNLELRGKLGGHPGFVPAKTTPTQGTPFSLVIHFGNDREERIEATIGGGQVIDALPEIDDDPDGDGPPDEDV